MVQWVKGIFGNRAGVRKTLCSHWSWSLLAVDTGYTAIRWSALTKWWPLSLLLTKRRLKWFFLWEKGLLTSVGDERGVSGGGGRDRNDE